MMRQDEENLRRFRGWWAVANKEQLVSFWFICIFSITIFSTLAYSTLHGTSITGQANLAFIRTEGEALKTLVAPWFGTFFCFGALSLILVARRSTMAGSSPTHQDIYLPASAGPSRCKLWSSGHDHRGSAILLSGFNQPLLLLVVAACLNGMVMFVYSVLLIQLNRRGLPPALRVRGLRLGMLVFAALFYGFFSGWLVVVQVQSYLGSL
jgi:hypothetical protein